mmetsp:Transcript_35905/g.61828  ORF Transcript_35905/g.61828 Transcript_35905/m.61828 type:complete len:435 (-) Transcript_35905:236-1540(-)
MKNSSLTSNHINVCSAKPFYPIPDTTKLRKYFTSYNMAQIHCFPPSTMLINTAFLLAGNRGSVRVRLRCYRSPGRLLLLLLLWLLLLAVLYVLLLLLLVLGLRSIPMWRALLHRHGVLHVHLLLLWGQLLLLLVLVGRIRRGISGRVHRVLRLLLLVSRWRPVGLLLRLMLLRLVVRDHLALLLGLTLLGHTSGGLGGIQVLRLLLRKMLALYRLVLHRILSDHPLLLQRWLLLVCDRGLLRIHWLLLLLLVTRCRGTTLIPVVAGVVVIIAILVVASLLLLLLLLLRLVLALCSSPSSPSVRAAAIGSTSMAHWFAALTLALTLLVVLALVVLVVACLGLLKSRLGLGVGPHLLLHWHRHGHLRRHLDVLHLLWGHAHYHGCGCVHHCGRGCLHVRHHARHGRGRQHRRRNISVVAAGIRRGVWRRHRGACLT